MELVWIEDFIELAATRNFSIAAASRNITQPAFSRRIRALENWVGAELIDRGTYPVHLTKAGETFLETSRGLARDMHRIRDECRRQEAAGHNIINISALHTIALSIFPNVMKEMSRLGLRFHCRMNATDFHDCIEALALDRVDIALCYVHPSGPPVLQTDQFISKCLMTDPFLLVSAKQAGEVKYPLGVNSSESLPLIAYSSDCYLGKIQTLHIQEVEALGSKVETVFENSMSETIKRVVLAGLGIGWLPRTAAISEIESGQLAVLHQSHKIPDLEVMAFRKRNNSNSSVEKFWNKIP